MNWGKYEGDGSTCVGCGHREMRTSAGGKPYAGKPYARDAMGLPYCKNCVQKHDEYADQRFQPPWAPVGDPQSFSEEHIARRAVVKAKEEDKKYYSSAARMEREKEKSKAMSDYMKNRQESRDAQEAIEKGW